MPGALVPKNSMANVLSAPLVTVEPRAVLRSAWAVPTPARGILSSDKWLNDYRPKQGRAERVVRPVGRSIRLWPRA